MKWGRVQPLREGQGHRAVILRILLYPQQLVQQAVRFFVVFIPERVILGDVQEPFRLLGEERECQLLVTQGGSAGAVAFGEHVVEFGEAQA